MTPHIPALISLALCAAPLAAQDIDTRPFVFTQGHNGQTQSIDFRREVQVQLPSNSGNNGGDPVAWLFQHDVSPEAKLLKTSLVPSPGRIEGFDTVTVFDFAVVPSGKPRIVISTGTGNAISASGEYVINFSY